jgi:hypothetical protein
MLHRRDRVRAASLNVVCVALLLIGLSPLASRPLAAAQPPAEAQAEGQTPLVEESPLLTSMATTEVRNALVRLPLAAVLGSALALRPRRRGQARRSVLVVQTQIMLAVVGAVIMLVVGNSLSRAFGIVGAAGLVRYRSTIDDPKEAVVMLCALAAGLASGVGLYLLAPFATLFMAGVLWIVEYFEPAAQKAFELAVTLKGAPAFRARLEGAMSGFHLEYELLSESDEGLGYSVTGPIDVRTKDISDTLRLLSGNEDIAIEWAEKKPRK